jgi:hypothetical protein
MADPYNIRLGPLAEPFDKAVEDTASAAPAVMRALVEAWLKYIEQHGHAPVLPLEIVPQKKKR